MKDYKDIWNNLSTTFADASFYVCCIGDEDEIRANGKLTAEFLQSVLQIEPADTVLEIGCGVARIGRELAASCAEWHGADISGNMIDYARERTADIPNIFLHELPDNSLSIFPDDTFDCVYSSIVFMHVDKLDMFSYICDAYRVLKPGGRVYFDTYNILAPDAWQEFFKVWTQYPYGQRPGHISQFSSPQELRKFMEEAGYDSVHIDDVNRQLVVTLGRKPLEQTRAVPRVPQSILTRPDAGGDADAAAQAARSPYEILQEMISDMDRKNEALARLEAELARKNQAIAHLEQRLRRRESELVAARAPRIRLPWARNPRRRRG
ncbi:MAG TPA: methyltransferase domain-containing protein [Chloroflexia bacterium]|nr:methyltransferase domain-containing protein [Chloroflexia bacterium]